MQKEGFVVDMGDPISQGPRRPVAPHVSRPLPCESHTEFLLKPSIETSTRMLST